LCKPGNGGNVYTEMAFWTKAYGEILASSLQLVNAKVRIHPETQNSRNVTRAYVRVHELHSFAPKKNNNEKLKK
jgi:hypothetical protein